jgi:hypothetical protein
MAGMAKEIANFRLTPEARALLRKLAALRGISMASQLELLIRDEAERRGVTVGARDRKTTR